MFSILSPEVAVSLQQLIDLAKEKYPMESPNRISNLSKKVTEHVQLITHGKGDGFREEIADLVIHALQIAETAGVDETLFLDRIKAAMQRVQAH